MGPTTEMLSNMSIAKYNSYCVKMHAACVEFLWRIICLDCSRSGVRPHTWCFCLPLINMHLLFMMSRKNLEHDRVCGEGGGVAASHRHSDVQIGNIQRCASVLLKHWEFLVICGLMTIYKNEIWLPIICIGNRTQKRATKRMSLSILAELCHSAI
jgi:hypothetical protein